MPVRNGATSAAWCGPREAQEQGGVAFFGVRRFIAALGCVKAAMNPRTPQSLAPSAAPSILPARTPAAVA